MKLRRTLLAVALMLASTACSSGSTDDTRSWEAPPVKPVHVVLQGRSASFPMLSGSTNDLPAVVAPPGPKPAPPPAPIVELPSDILFETGSFTLKPTAVNYLHGIAARDFSIAPEGYVTITGHTDSRDTVQNNLVLSVKRADAVGRVFESVGYRPDHVIIRGAGEGRPVVADVDPAGHFIESAGRRNRRVEVSVSG